MTTLADIQRHVGVTPDGAWGPHTARAIAAALGMKRNPAPSPEAAAIIKEFEGCHKRLPDGTFAAYPDPGSGGDPWTIGWGSTGPDIKRGTIWTQAQCDARFAEHLAEFGAKVAELLRGAPTTQAQFDAMTSLAYNIGTGNFGSSTLLRKHRAGDYAAAADQFAVWNRASGRVMAGLTRRRAAEAAMYRGHSA